MPSHCRGASVPLLRHEACICDGHKDQAVPQRPLALPIRTSLQCECRFRLDKPNALQQNVYQVLFPEHCQPCTGGSLLPGIDLAPPKSVRLVVLYLMPFSFCLPVVKCDFRSIDKNSDWEIWPVNKEKQARTNLLLYMAWRYLVCCSTFPPVHYLALHDEGGAVHAEQWQSHKVDDAA